MRLRTHRRQQIVGFSEDSEPHHCAQFSVGSSLKSLGNDEELMNKRRQCYLAPTLSVCSCTEWLILQTWSTLLST